MAMVGLVGTIAVVWRKVMSVHLMNLLLVIVPLETLGMAAAVAAAASVESSLMLKGMPDLHLVLALSRRSRHLRFRAICLGLVDKRVVATAVQHLSRPTCMIQVVSNVLQIVHPMVVKLRVIVRRCNMGVAFENSI